MGASAGPEMTIRRTIHAAIIFLMAITGASAETRYRDRIEYYDISGNINSRADVRQAIRTFGPLVRGKEAIGSARGQIGTSYKFERSGGRCTITDATVKVNVVMRLPSWEFDGSAKRDVRGYFGCFQRTVTVHEKRHGQIWRETGQAIEKSMYRELRDLPCNSFKSRAKHIYDREYRIGRQRQRTFDEEDYQRPRYQRCERGPGPQVEVKASPLLRSFARKPLPTKRFDVSDEPPQQPAGQEIAAPATYEPTTERTATPSLELSLDTTHRLLGSAGIVIGVAIAILGLFAGFMFYASRLERQREILGPGLDGLNTDDLPPQYEGNAPPPRKRSAAPPPRRQAQGFGRRGQRP